MFCFINNLFPNEANISIHPENQVCGGYQTIKIEFFTHNMTIKSGGGFRFELPVGYLETKPYYWDIPQIDIIEGKGFVSVKSVERINWKRKKIRIYKIILKTFLKEIKKQKYLYK